MANVNSLTSTSTSTSSLYGNRNVLSGLASGLDTESMIENSIQGYKMKIQGFTQKQTQTEWKQDAYREFTDTMNVFMNQYASTSSKTNLSSATFWNNAVTVNRSGENANKVAAVGKSTSDISINSIESLASAASYSVKLSDLVNIDSSPELQSGAASVSLNTKLSEITEPFVLDEGNFTMVLGRGTENQKNINLRDLVEGGINENTTLKDVMDAINKNDVGVTVKYSTTAQAFTFTTTETGNGATLFFENDLGSFLGRPGETGSYKAGSDAIVNATINGMDVQLREKSNTIDFDGMSVTLKGTFGVDGYGNQIAGTEPIDFTVSADSDKIVDAVKAFVDDYNTLVKDIYSAVTTRPASKSDGSSYLPLTEEDKSGMSESAIKAYEDNAKKGLLFGDSDLKSLFNDLRSAIANTDRDTTRALEEMGITTQYASGVTTLDLDEDKLRSVLDADPDKVKNVFADSPGYNTNDGFVGKIKTVMNKYADTSFSNSGILVKKAGSKLSSRSLLDNDLLKIINRYQEQIDTWNTKMLKQVDHYTRMFSKLEQLMNTMNSQSSSLAEMMGGY